MFDFSEFGGLSQAAEQCGGVGACRKTLSGTMCPSYMATREEKTRPAAARMRCGWLFRVSLVDGLDRSRVVSGPRPLLGMQSLQERMSDGRRYGADEE